MEIERIQKIHGLRVERTGSESERRRHQRPDEDFNEMLEHSLKDGAGAEHEAGGNEHTGADNGHPPLPPAPGPVAAALLIHDTVSISSLAPPAPTLSTDKVTLSSTALVSAESLKATQGALRISLVQRAALELRDIAADKPAAPNLPTQPEPLPPTPGSVDTLA